MWENNTANGFRIDFYIGKYSLREMYINLVTHVCISACRKVIRLLMDPSAYQSPSIQPEFTGYM